MVQAGIKGIRATFADAMGELSASAEILDPAPEIARDDHDPGQWPGAPASRLPPLCPVIPLGVDGKTSFFVDCMGQLISLSASEWSKKTLLQLFALQPNYLYWAWPRWNAKTLTINGLEVDDAVQCLLNGAAKRGLFSPIDRVRGRGAWSTNANGMLWHAGDGIYAVEPAKRGGSSRLTVARPGEVEGVFYPQRPAITRPWQEPVDPDDTPAHEILEALRSWNWERPALDPILAIGAIGCMFLGAALPWRPHLFVVGDKGVGKSTLQGLVKAILGDALHACADTTPAGIYQRVKQDSLPVGIDELEANADNRRVMGVVALARLAASGAMMFRGGAEHEGVEFRLQNTFLFSAINPPPLLPQDKSRMAILNLGRLAPQAQRKVPTIDADVTGRMILRALMDAWPRFDATLAAWKDALFQGGRLDERAQATYGTLLTVANLLLGDADLARAGFDVAKPKESGLKVAAATSQDRAEQSENWRACIERLLSSTIESWRGGDKPTVGKILDEWEHDILKDDEANLRLDMVGLRCKREIHPERMSDDRYMLAVPINDQVGLAKLFAETPWQKGVWASALKQAPPAVVVRDRGNGQNVRISRVVQRCLLIDLKAYDAHVEEGK